MTVVHKLSFDFSDLDTHPNRRITRDLPVGSVVLKSAQNQRGQLCVWYIPGLESDPTNPRINNKTEKYQFWFLETGKKIPKVNPNALDFLGTVLFEEGEYVLHAFVERYPAT